MGGLMREYWIPAAKSSELVTGGAPVRILSAGREAHRVPRRLGPRRRHGPSLSPPGHVAPFFWCPNEKDGLRCVYHGWKFDVTGQCLEQPNVPLRDRDPSTRRRRGPTPPPTRTAWCGSTWAGARCRRPLLRPARNFASRRSWNVIAFLADAPATGCRRSRARSTTRTPVSCTPAMSIPTSCRRTSRCATR